MYFKMRGYQNSQVNLLLSISVPKRQTQNIQPKPKDMISFVVSPNQFQEDERSHQNKISNLL